MATTGIQGTSKQPRSQPPLLREVIDIKPRISTSDFVLKLAEAVTPEGAAQALRDYVITDRLVENYDEALGLIRAALDGRTSKAAYLHGSFGSGKSHFMAVLHALLRGDQAARGRDEFAGLLRKNEDWLGRRKFLLVPYHLLGAKSLEQRVLGGYVAHIRQLHPSAPTPQVYRTDALFENIQRTRANVGDETFIAQLGKVPDPASAGRPSPAEDAEDEWGETFAWTSAKLDTALRAQQAEELKNLNLVSPRTPAELRTKLVHDALIGWFPGFFANAAEDEFGFVSLDRGLAVIAQHAKSLGYDGLILFLDELVLWLANAIKDQKFVAREAGKITNFVEGGDARRAIPVISFIARQRDLRELVGQEISGAAEAAIQDTLSLASGRFDLITLEDRNLPVIANKRLLQPIDADAKAKLDAAFAKAQRVRPDVWDVLLGSDEGTTGADADSFRLTYPFSPAFMDTLVHISSALQRSRTGLKLMGQLLADHRDDARLEQLVPLGDLYEVISRGGDEPFVEKLKAEFKAAQRLYQTKLRPYLLDAYTLTDEDVERVLQSSAQDTDPQLRQRVTAFLGDNRLICTLLLSALAPSVPALRDLTIRRLTALNHGSITSPIPGGEVGIVKNKVDEWASRFAEIKATGSDANPGVRLELVGVDVDSVINNARVNNTPGNRKALINRLLWEELGVTAEGRDTDQIRLVWRGSSRAVEAVLGNIADRDDLQDHDFVPVQDGSWRLVVDMPYDEGTYGPPEDRSRVMEFKTSPGEKARTVCWIPAHFTAARREDFERLVTIDAALRDPQRFDTQYAAHLNPNDRQRAKALLERQRESLTVSAKKLLAQAYGLAQKQPADVTAYDDHLIALPEVELRTAIGQPMRDAVRHVAATLLAEQFPAHPDFDPDRTGVPVRREDTKTVFEYVRAASETPDGRVEVVQKDRRLMGRIVGPLRLGVQHEAYFQLGRYWVEHFNQKAGRDPKDLSVIILTDWIDQPEPMGLEDFLATLVIAAYAEQEDRVWTRGGGLIEPQPATLTEIRASDALRRQPLPDADTWQRAGERAAQVFGITAPTLLRGRLVTHLAKQVTAAAQSYRSAAHDLVAQLEKHAAQLGLDLNNAGGDNARLDTARRAAAFLDALTASHHGGGSGAKNVVATLANFDLAAQPERVGTSVKSASDVTRSLVAGPWDVLPLATSLGEPYATEARAVLGALHGAAQADELTSRLGDALTTARREILALVTRANAARQAAQQSGPMTGNAAAGTGTAQPTAQAVPLNTESSHPQIHETSATNGDTGTGSRPGRRSGGGRAAARNAVAELRAELGDLVEREPNAVIELTWRIVE